MHEPVAPDPSTEPSAEASVLPTPHTPTGLAAPVVTLPARTGLVRRHRRWRRGYRRHERRLHRLIERARAADRDVVREQIRLRDATGDLATADGHAANAVHLGATEDRGAWFPKSLAWLIAAAAITGLWFVDRTLLLSLRLPLFETQAFTAIAVAASAASAYATGVLWKRRHHAPHGDYQLGTHERVARAAFLAIGATIETTLGLIRTLATGAVISSVVFTAAGLGLFSFVAYSAYMAHDGLRTSVHRARRHRNRRVKTLARRIAVADRCTTAVATAQTAMATHAELAVDDALAAIAASTALTHTTPPPTPEWITTAHTIATHHYPPCCTYTPPTFTPTQEPHS